MPFANVYLNATTRGTTTNEQGQFSLPRIPLGVVEVVASFVGYQPLRKTFRIESAQPRKVIFRLKPSDHTLATVMVRGNLKKWQQHLRQFKQQLLGEPFGGQCQIMNTDVLSFTEEEGHLKAVAAEPLIIENLALGYRFWYDLLYFDGTSRKVYYGGTTRFEELKATDQRQVSRFQRNRMRAYTGSTRHLMASLIAGTYEQEGFLVYQENVSVPIVRTSYNRTSLAASIKGHLLPLDLKTLILPGRLPFERRLVSDKQLIVFYTHALSAYSPYTDAHYAYSQITIPTGEIQLTVDGSITLPEGMEIQGSLADDRLSTMLPADWQPDKSDADPVNDPVVAQGQLLPADARLGELATAFNERFRMRAPMLFVHTDKPLYGTGDRLWLSAYLVDAATSQRPAGETAIHVDLLTASGKRVQHQWLRATEGRAVGTFRLSDSLASGRYRLRAYTDEDKDQHRPAFERSIAVYNLFQSRTPDEISPVRKPLDIQLLPEGGHWVAGLSARVGIKVLAPTGHGTASSGWILDETQTRVSPFTTTALGMGSVVMTPRSGHTYYAQVSHENQTQVVPLPLVEADGYVLSADMVSDTSRLTLTISATNRPVTDSVYVLIQQQGRLVDQRKIRLQNGLARVSLPVAILPPGLNQITLYDANSRPQAERLVFLPQNLPPVHLLVNVNKIRHQPRESTILSVNLSDDGIATGAALSVAVTDADQVPNDTAAATFPTHWLLTGELRGRIEQPNFYVRNSLPETRRALDDLLLTQGWRRVRGTPSTEQSGGVALQGRVLNSKNGPIAGVQVTVTSTVPNQTFVRSVETDTQGRFQLSGLAIADTVQLLTQLTDRQLKALPAKDARLVFEEHAELWDMDTTSQLTDWATWQNQLAAARIRQEDDASQYRDQTARLLKEVVVRASKRDERPDDVRRMSLHGEADATLKFDDRSPRFTNLYEMLRGKVAGVSVTQAPLSGGYQVIIRGVGSFKVNPQPLFLMDGMPIQDSEGTALLSFNPADIERIEVLKNAGTTGTYGVRGGSGVIAFYSKRFRSEPVAAGAKTGASTVQFIGYSSVQREFYVPRYETDSLDHSAGETQSGATARVDHRDVLYWNPLIQTDGQGHSQIRFPLSDVVRTIRVTIQGITATGRPVADVKLIRVQ